MWASHLLAVEINLIIIPLNSQFTSSSTVMSSVSLVRTKDIFLLVHRATETPGSGDDEREERGDESDGDGAITGNDDLDVLGTQP